MLYPPSVSGDRSPSRLPVVIVDYGAGNLRSVFKAFELVGAAPIVTNSPRDVEKASALVLPGVGAARDTMHSLEALELVGPIRDFIASGRCFFGVCLGLQVLLDGSEEGGGQSCLGVIPGVVRRLPPGQKVPHMGWNQVQQLQPHIIFQGIPDGANFYFVHSYYACPQDHRCAVGQTDYGVTFASVLAQGNLIATQFHPEKSGDIGLQMYANFVRWAALDPEVAPMYTNGS